MDLFHHKMLKTSFFSCFCIPVNSFHFFLDLFSVQIVEGNFLFADLCHLQVANIVYISCIFQNSRHIWCNKTLSISYAKNHRTVFSCHINFFRIILEHHSKRIRSTNTDQRMVDRIYRCSFILFIIIIDQLNSNLCIRLRVECISFAEQLVL